MEVVVDTSTSSLKVLQRRTGVKDILSKKRTQTRTTKARELGNLGLYLEQVHRTLLS